MSDPIATVLQARVGQQAHERAQTAPSRQVTALAEDAAEAPRRDSLVRRLHEATTTAALDEVRGSDGLSDQWELRDRLRAERWLQRQRSKLRR